MSELKNLEIEEISLVDAGANPEAEILLFKRKAAQAENADVEKAFARLNRRLEEHIAQAENAELLKVASKYEILGEKAEELAATLKKMKTAGVYAEYISKLERELEYVQKAGVFEELGKSGRSSFSADVEKMAAEFQKADPTLSWRFALDKAYQKVGKGNV